MGMMMMMFNTSEDICMSIGVMASYCFFGDDSSVSVCHFHFQFRSFCPLFPIVDVALLNMMSIRSSQSNCKTSSGELFVCMWHTLAKPLMD